MLRIAQFIESVDMRAGGTSTAFLSTLEALRTLGDKVHVHAFARRPRTDEPVWSTIRARISDWTLSDGIGRGLRGGELGMSVAHAAARREFDLLHIHGLWSPDLLAAAQGCRRAGIPYLWEPHGMLVREAYNQKRLKKEVFMALGMRAALSAASGLVFVTSEERDHSVIPPRIGPDKRHVVPLPVITPAMPIDSPFRAAARTRFNVPTGSPCVVFMGRLHPVKRVEMAIDALALMPAGTTLLLIGGGEAAYVDTLKSHAKARGVLERVNFAGWVQGEDKWTALAAGDVLTLNSLHENFGFVAVEALCVGTFPVLTSNLAIAGELAGAGVGASCTPDAQGLSRAWASALGGASTDPMQVLTRGRAWVDQHLSTHAVGAALLRVYQQCAR